MTHKVEECLSHHRQECLCHQRPRQSEKTGAVQAGKPALQRTMSALATQLAPAAAADPTATEAVGTSALAKTLDDRPVLEDVTIAIPAGRYVALLGANGAGKSTLLKVLATLTPPTSG